MTMTNGDIISLYEGLINLREGRSAALPIKVGFTLIKDMKILEPLYLAAMSIRDEKVQQYGETQEDGQIFIPKEKVDELNDELRQLQEIENDVALDTVLLSDLEQYAFSLGEITTLYPIIREA